jgi:AcrR family transcriptional regulator
LKTRSKVALVGTVDGIAKPEIENKVRVILLGTLAALTDKGYANTTIDHIARASSVSRGLLHYYFKSKEDLIVQAVTLGSGSLLDSAIERIDHANSADDLADIMIEVLKENAEQHPTITALLIEVWGGSRRNARLRVAFEEGFRKTTGKLAAVIARYIHTPPSGDIRSPETASRILLGLYLGLVVQLISQPDLLADNQFRVSLRALVLHTIHCALAQSGD